MSREKRPDTLWLHFVVSCCMYGNQLKAKDHWLAFSLPFQYLFLFSGVLDTIKSMKTLPWKYSVRTESGMN